MIREGGHSVNCIEARRMVTPYVNKELSDKEMELFLDHIEHCSDCMDELDIYFTVYRALDSLDSGAHHEFDFKKMLEEDIRMEHRAILRRKAVRAARGILMVLAEVLLLLSIYTGYQMKQGEMASNAIQKAIHRLYARPIDRLADPDLDLEEKKEIVAEEIATEAVSEKVPEETAAAQKKQEKAQEQK